MSTYFSFQKKGYHNHINNIYRAVVFKIVHIHWVYRQINILVIWFEHILLHYNITNGSGTSSKYLDRPLHTCISLILIVVFAWSGQWFWLHVLPFAWFDTLILTARSSVCLIWHTDFDCTFFCLPDLTHWFWLQVLPFNWFHTLILTAGSSVYLISRRVWPVNRGCLLPLGTWSHIQGSVLALFFLWLVIPTCVSRLINLISHTMNQIHRDISIPRIHHNINIPQNNYTTK
jgi:hypothetical protein